MNLGKVESSFQKRWMLSKGLWMWQPRKMENFMKRNRRKSSVPPGSLCEIYWVLPGKVSPAESRSQGSERLREHHMLSATDSFISSLFLKIKRWTFRSSPDSSYCHLESWIVFLGYCYTHRQTNRQMDGLTDGPTDRQTGRYTNCSVHLVLPACIYFQHWTLGIG